MFDNNLTMNDHVDSVCITFYFFIRLLGKLRRFLNKETAAKVTYAFVTPSLDYCNFLLYGISKFLTVRFQRVLNTAARIVTKTKIRSHITPVLKVFHWLPVEQRCAFKTALLTCKAILAIALSYFCQLVKYRFTFRNLRSQNELLLDVPKFLLSTDSRAFTVAAPMF